MQLFVAINKKNITLRVTFCFTIKKNSNYILNP